MYTCSITAPLEIAFRIVGNHLGLYPERVRRDGYDMFVRPESEYDAARAHPDLAGRASRARRAVPAAPLPSAANSRFPALARLDEGLARLPATSRKILAFMPVHVAAPPAGPRKVVGRANDA